MMGLMNATIQCNYFAIVSLLSYIYSLLQINNIFCANILPDVKKQNDLNQSLKLLFCVLKSVAKRERGS